MACSVEDLEVCLKASEAGCVNGACVACCVKTRMVNGGGRCAMKSHRVAYMRAVTEGMAVPSPKSVALPDGYVLQTTTSEHFIFCPYSLLHVEFGREGRAMELVMGRFEIWKVAVRSTRTGCDEREIHEVESIITYLGPVLKAAHHIDDQDITLGMLTPMCTRLAAIMACRTLGGIPALTAFQKALRVQSYPAHLKAALTEGERAAVSVTKRARKSTGCFKCGKEGHRKANCPTNATEPDAVATVPSAPGRFKKGGRGGGAQAQPVVAPTSGNGTVSAAAVANA